MLLALLAVLAGSTPAAATSPSNPAAAPPAASAAPAAKKEEMVCKTEQVTGSMFPRKVCRRKDEAARAALEEQEQLRRDQKLSTTMGH